LELIVAAAFVISYLFWPFSFATAGIILFAIWLLILVLFAALAVYDARWRLLPNKLVFPLIGLALVFAIINYFFIQQVDFANFLINIVLGLLPIAGLYGLLFLVSRGAWVGFGDVKLGLAIGFLIPWQQGLLVLILANLLGCLAILPLLIRKKLKPGSQIPFGPCLIFAGVIAVLFGQIIVDFARKNLLLM
jgi:leader peptidase (prepilin peptidase)/N-methyltransferase